MSTYNFVKETGRDKIWEMLQAEYKEITDPATGMIYEKYQKPVKCCACGADDCRQLWIKDGFRFVKCRGCGLVYVNPQLAEEAIYDACRSTESADAWVDLLLSEAQLAYDEKKFRGAVEELTAMRQPGRLLDCGCSVGIFMKLAKEAGWDVTGLELTPKAVAYARETLGLNVLEKTIEDANLEPESFDVVTLWEVLEHIPTPARILKDIHTIMKPGGILVALVPNLDSLTVRVLQEKCSAFGGRDHLWYFNAETISKLLEKEGYKVFKSQTEVGDLDTLLNYLQFEEPYIGKGQTPWAQLLTGPMRPAIEQAMFKMGIGYKLRVHARKI